MLKLLILEKKYNLSQKKKKKCALARHPILSAKEGYCRYNYMFISPTILCLTVLLSVWSVFRPDRPESLRLSAHGVFSFCLSVYYIRPGLVNQYRPSVAISLQKEKTYSIKYILSCEVI